MTYGEIKDLASGITEASKYAASEEVYEIHRKMWLSFRTACELIECNPVVLDDPESGSSLVLAIPMSVDPSDPHAVDYPSLRILTAIFEDEECDEYHEDDVEQECMQRRRIGFAIPSPAREERSDHEANP